MRGFQSGLSHCGGREVLLSALACLECGILLCLYVCVCVCVQDMDEGIVIMYPVSKSTLIQVIVRNFIMIVMTVLLDLG